MNKYLSIAIILSAMADSGVGAQTLTPTPQLVVNITIDRLRTDYLEQFSELYGEDGFKKLLQLGRVYESVSHNFTPVDRASATAAIMTGTTPHYNNITGTQWLDRNTLRPVSCTYDERYKVSPQKIASSTISDELKVATDGLAIVYSVAVDRETAVISAGHAGDGAFWIDERTDCWTTSNYYSSIAQRFIKAYNASTGYNSDNDGVVQLALSCVSDLSMGIDSTTDMLSVTLSAEGTGTLDWQTDMEILYLKLDKTLAELITAIEEKVGEGNTLFVLASTGCTDTQPVDYEKYRIPTGTFYINRTANLLNMYLGATFGQGQYIETCYNNQIYINHKLLEQRKISLNDVVERSKELLALSDGVRSVKSSPYNQDVSGDIIIELSPGWKLINEDTQETFIPVTSYVPFPVIFYGVGVKAGLDSTPVTTDRIAPTIAKSIRIRAPNACTVAPLR